MMRAKLLLSAFVAVLAASAARADDFVPTSSYEARTIEGWKVLISPDIGFDPETRDRLLAIVTEQLKQVGTTVPPAALAKIKHTRLWIEPASDSGQIGRYYADVNSIDEEGLNPDKAFGVEVTTDGLEETDLNPSLILHELAHAYYEQVLAFDVGPIGQAFEAAQASGKYDSVDVADGEISRAYALVDQGEFFAELTEAYYGRNDFFPFNRAELEAFDAASAKAIREAWER